MSSFRAAPKIEYIVYDARTFNKYSILEFISIKITVVKIACFCLLFSAFVQGKVLI